MWELDHEEGWVAKKWCFQIVVLDKTLESPLDCKEIKLINPRGSQTWIFIGRTDSEAEALWLSGMKSQLVEKDFDTGKDWRRKEKGVTEDEMFRWHHWLNGHESEQAPGDGEEREAWRAAVLAAANRAWDSDWTITRGPEITVWRKWSEIIKKTFCSSKTPVSKGLIMYPAPSMVKTNDKGNLPGTQSLRLECRDWKLLGKKKEEEHHLQRPAWTS